MHAGVDYANPAEFQYLICFQYIYSSSYCALEQCWIQRGFKGFKHLRFEISYENEIIWFHCHGLKNKRALGPWVAHLKMTDQWSCFV